MLGGHKSRKIATNKAANPWYNGIMFQPSFAGSTSGRRNMELGDRCAALEINGPWVGGSLRDTIGTNRR